MAHLALRPQLSGVVEADVEYRLEEMVAGEGSEAVGQTVGDIRGGSMIVGLRRQAEFHPRRRIPRSDRAPSSSPSALRLL
jgi:hypothetical protein